MEVKHFIRSRRALPTIRRVLENFESLLQNRQWKRVKVVLAVVLHHASEVEETRRQLMALKSEFDFPLDIRCYSLEELQARFGLE